MRRHQTQRGDCGAGGGCGLRASVPGPLRQHPRELRAEPGQHRPPQPRWFAKPNTARCVTTSASPHGDTPGPPANGVPPHPVSLLFGEEHVTPCPSWSSPAQAVCLQAQGSLGSCRAVVASTALVAPVRVTRGAALTSHPSQSQPYSMIAGLGAISQGGFKP